MSTQAGSRRPSCVAGQLALLEHKLANINSYSRLVDTTELQTDQQIAIFLYICHTGAPFSHLGASYKVPALKVQEVFENVRDALLVLFDEYVKIPEMPDGIKDPEMLDDPAFVHFRTTMVQVVGAAVICGIGRCCTQPGEIVRDPARDYTGPQRLVLTVDIRGKFTSVYAPSFDNTMSDDVQNYSNARTADCLPRLPYGKWILAASPDLMHSGHKMIGVFSDAYYPTSEEALENCKPRDAHGRFNLFHSRLYHALAVRPLMATFWGRFALLDLPDARVSADLFKACVVVYNFFMVEK